MKQYIKQFRFIIPLIIDVMELLWVELLPSFVGKRLWSKSVLFSRILAAIPVGILCLFSAVIILVFSPLFAYILLMCEQDEEDAERYIDNW